MDFENSRTKANLYSAFAGESQARTKYNVYADQARKEGYQHLGDLFDTTAANEWAHATMWLKHINGGAIKSTTDNLVDAMAGEHFEWSEMYKEYAQVAKEEGFTQIAAEFELVAGIEKMHEDRYRKMSDDLKQQMVFKKPTSVSWICRNCGYVYEGAEAPKICPVCKYPQAFFEVKCEA
ncbi:MAG TPA: rubrerythrin family protein [Firmicutes bacterium]|nr:rubrerythrin family protein [Bacillota bacterium]